MKEKPITFSGEMVRAILDGRKTMTRRVVKWPDWITDHARQDAEEVAAYRLNEMKKDGVALMEDGHPVKIFKRPYNPGDRLWVKEDWGMYHDIDENHVIYKGDIEEHDGNSPEERWRNPRFMPRWASRISLEVQAVRIERLQGISESECFFEGIQPRIVDHRAVWETEVGVNTADTPIDAFKSLWNSIHGKKPENQWDKNPWVVVIEFHQ